MSALPHSLTVDDRTAALEAGNVPRFGWLFSSSDPGDLQTAYRITVHTGPGAEPEQIWDSGLVHSRRSDQIRYGGTPLPPGQDFTWTVRTWGRSSSGEARAGFSTAISDQQWQAAWIRRPETEADDRTLSRTEFEIAAAPITRARLFVCALHQFRVWVEGQLLDQGAVHAYPGEMHYQTTDVTSRLPTGQRVAIGVLHRWCGPGQGRPEAEPGLLLRLEIDHADGTRQVVVSDGSWRTTRGPWLPDQWRNDDGRDYVEHLDGRIESRQTGWQNSGFDDHDWEPATVVQAHPGPRFGPLHPQTVRLARHPVRPVTVARPAPGTVLADFGAIRPGVPRVRFRRGVSGRTVHLRGGHVLTPEGTVSTTLPDTQETDLGYRHIQADGEQTFEALTYLGLRYLQIDGADEDLGCDEISLTVQHAAVDAERTATFESSDPTLDAVFALMQRSALYCSQQHFLDTPTREKGQFLADAVNISAALAAGHGDRALTARAIEEFAWSRLRYWPDGRVNAVYPNGDGRRDIPDFTAMYPGWVRDVHRRTGNPEIPERAGDTCAAVAGYLLRHVDPGTGLVTDLSGGGDGPYRGGLVDWPVRYEYDLAVSARTSVNVLAVDALRATAEILRALGRPGPAVQELSSAADALAAAVNTRLRRADGLFVDGLYADGSPSTSASQLANAYAVGYGVADLSESSSLEAFLGEGPLRMGPMTAHLLLRALYRLGRPDLVLARLTDPAGPGWAQILARGGTFLWEDWDAPVTGTSHSHAWGAAALPLLQECLLGVSCTTPPGTTPPAGSTAPAGSTVPATDLRVDPPTGTALTWARGSLWTRSGRVTVNWQTHRGGTDIDLVLPANTTAEVVVRFDGSTPPTATGAAPGGGRLQPHRIADGRAVYTVGSGTSHFRTLADPTGPTGLTETARSSPA